MQGLPRRGSPWLPGVQNTVLPEANLTIACVIKLAQNMEAAHKNTLSMKTPSHAVAAIGTP